MGMMNDESSHEIVQHCFGTLGLLFSVHTHFIMSVKCTKLTVTAKVAQLYVMNILWK